MASGSGEGRAVDKSTGPAIDFPRNGVFCVRDRYLKTEADGEQPNNLLSLTECP
ncbi:DUF3892 domain-containing protein [Sorangium sp. So ce131]|uniref:DUF3892 domain-containing protein n=1 Tax=Sorangium sp. So ce131 TaxID=3133282 RepID=UPI003F61A11C